MFKGDCWRPRPFSLKTTFGWRAPPGDSKLSGALVFSATPICAIPTDGQAATGWGRRVRMCPGARQKAADGRKGGGGIRKRVRGVSAAVGPLAGMVLRFGVAGSAAKQGEGTLTLICRGRMASRPKVSPKRRYHGSPLARGGGLSEGMGKSPSLRRAGRKMADRIQARAIRRCGELLKTFNSPGGRPQKTNDGTVIGYSQRQAASSAGMSRDQQRQAVRVATREPSAARSREP